MLKGKCPRCEACYYGWSLRSPQNQVCIVCGVGLEVIEGEKPSANAPPSNHKETDNSSKK